MTYKFVIEKDARNKPYMPPSLNKLLRSHWGALNHAIAKTRRILLDQLESQNLVQTSGKRRVDVCYYFKVKRRRDPDNYCKVLFDAMMQTGIIADDDPEHLEYRISFAIDRKRPRVEIEVEDV